jgi:hypothetical protein
MILLATEQKTESKGPRKTQGLWRTDYLGIAAFAIMVTNLSASIELFGRGESEMVNALVFLGVTFCFGVLFLLMETYHAKEPLIPLSLLKTVLGIYSLIQMLLLLGHQAAFHLPAHRSSSQFKMTDTDSA